MLVSINIASLDWALDCDLESRLNASSGKSSQGEFARAENLLKIATSGKATLVSASLSSKCFAKVFFSESWAENGVR